MLEGETFPQLWNSFRKALNTLLSPHLGCGLPVPKPGSTASVADKSLWIKESAKCNKCI